MPTDGDFGFSVLVAGLPVPEYTKGGHTYVESNLWTPVSYQQSVREYAYGELEEQSWPVTPYTIRVFTEPHCTLSWFDIYVDGVRVNKRVIGGPLQREWTSEGFLEEDGIREFLFALPRFAMDEKDRVASHRKSKIGTIEVVRKHATYLGEVYDHLHIDKFEQANKKDTFGVTQGKHTMSTTRKGNFVKKHNYSYGKRSQYNVGRELGRLSVFYHMGHTLQDMGITLKKMDWKQAQTVETVKQE